MTRFAIETDGLSKRYRTLWPRRDVLAVDGVSLRVERGATYGLLGPNGAGKTTFVKMLLAAVHPTQGRALIFGRDAWQPEARRAIGYLPENHRFPTYLTAWGMLDFYGALSGMEARLRRRRIPELLELVGLSDWAKLRLGKFSKGMLQRLGLAQALLHEPQLLILDEPSDGVDPVGRRQIREILQRLEQKGVTIFINSHLLAEVELFCRQVAILKKGQVVLEGRTQELTAAAGYKLSVAAPIPEVLCEQLGRMAVAATCRDGLMDFDFAGRAEANAAIDLLRSQKIEIESVVRARSTLEDVFIRSVND